MPWTLINQLEESELSWFNPEEDVDMEVRAGASDAQRPLDVCRTRPLAVMPKEDDVVMGEGELPTQSLKPLESHQLPDSTMDMDENTRRPPRQPSRSRRPRDTPPENSGELMKQGEGSTENLKRREDVEGGDVQEGGRTAGSEDVDMDGGGRSQGPNGGRPSNTTQTGSRNTRLRPPPPNGLGKRKIHPVPHDPKPTKSKKKRVQDQTAGKSVETAIVDESLVGKISPPHPPFL